MKIFVDEYCIYYIIIVVCVGEGDDVYICIVDQWIGLIGICFDLVVVGSLGLVGCFVGGGVDSI